MVFTRPTPARQDALFRGQGRSERVKLILPSLLVYVAQDDPDESPTARVQRGPSFLGRALREQRGLIRIIPPLLAGFFSILLGIFN